MASVARWWAVMTVIGWLAWPLAAAVVRRVPGRGYAVARALGLLTLSYVYWLLGVAGIVPNTMGALWGVMAVLAIVGVLGWWRARRELAPEVRRAWRHILLVEALFAFFFVLYALHKAHDPAIDHTEEPMDFAFLNTMVRSPRFPPNDPWLAGHAVSYYYLGYLTIALVGRLAGVPMALAYNLGLGHTLALTVTGAYGVIWGVLRARRKGRDATAHAVGIVGGVGLGLAGNGVGLLEALRARGLLATDLAHWFGVPGLADAAPTGSWLPDGHWWWWRASRVIADVNILGKAPTVITEFPAFSLILGDLHPHVMALPYLVLGIGIAAALYTWGADGGPRGWGAWACLGVATLSLGALGFVNTWELPTGIALGALGFVGGRLRGGAARGRAWRDGAFLGGGLLAAAILLYLPFYQGLSTQAQGIGLTYYAKTPLRQFALCFTPWLLPALVEVAACARALQGEGLLRRALVVWAGVVVAPWAFTAVVGGPGRLILGLGVAALSGAAAWAFLSAAVAILAADLLFASRAPTMGVWLARAALLVGFGLAYGCEFVYLRDVFDTRMNTVFKFYYQAWVLLGVGAALAAYGQWRSGGWKRASVALSAALVVLSGYYPLAAGYTRAGGYRGAATLDGTTYLRETSAAEYGAYRELEAAAKGDDVVIEAPGAEYDAGTSRLSAWTGVPTVLGWPGHEVQWRGGEGPWLAARTADLETIYTSADRETVGRLVTRYGATYLYIGPHERATYGLDEARVAWFDAWLETIYRAGEVRLYRVP